MNAESFIKEKEITWDEPFTNWTRTAFKKALNEFADKYHNEQLIIHSVVPKGTLPKSDAEITKQALKNYGTGQAECRYEEKTAYVKGAIDYRDNKIEPL